VLTSVSLCCLHSLLCVYTPFNHLLSQAFERNPNLASLLVDSEFANEVNSRQSSWRRVVSLCVATGIACPSMGASLSYFDAYRRARLPANLTQAQRDFFGSHTFERTDKPRGEAFHCKWTDAHA
jgi:6-phosphogluconate dehydrogenase